MPTNEEGEFELVLGNKQLLSVFFIMVVLLGVFFTMGYIVGRSAVPADTQVASVKAGQLPIVVEPRGQAHSAATSPEPPPSTERPSPAGTVVEPPNARPPSETASPPRTEGTEPGSPQPAPAQPEPPKSAPVNSGTPVPGEYLQVAATRQSEADLLAEVLSKKGYAATTMPVPDSSLVRVLVGPLAPQNVPATRSALEAAGFKPLPRRF